MQLVSKEWIDKRIPAAKNMHTTIEEPVTKQQIGLHTTVRVAGNGVFCSVHAKWL
jgi:hypothetical protein